jgi:hypothetical protein
MSFLPTAFLTFFGDEREREIEESVSLLEGERERGGCSKKATLREREGGGEEVQESCGKAWHGL